ncbi:MAG: Cytosol aminopeptidase PepA [uncultured Nocardioidaceae bacterium]|uniref:Probable cytosol aminopeptidase n=1 Tax=uncultured Nocardioidaceae bacterium TaxID=253824 RepID=A0A6J4M7W6_9ACTN|nr:MAG: Cytosol aminopeptidase PepA [uncultured Nocardioidaceae bacterium]
MTLPGQVSPPEITLSDAVPTQVPGVHAVAVPVIPDGDGPMLGPGAAELLDELHLDIFDLLEHHQSVGRAGEVVCVPVAPGLDGGPSDLRLALFVGVGEQTTTDLRRAAAALARHANGTGRLATTLGLVSDDGGLRAVVEGLVLGSFGFHRSSTGPPAKPVADVVLAGVTDSPAGRETLARGLAIARAGWRAREMALVPSNEKNPVWMARRAEQIADSSGLRVRVWDEKQLAAEGFGGLVGVGQASASPPRMIRLDYTPDVRTGAEDGRGREAGSVPHIVLVGKGITFDTGGLSLKPADAMMNMKRDMTGGAVVLATMGALADVGCPVRVTGLVPCAENAVGAESMRPGDVVTHYNGRTSEVTNTDAEGRLVLADAMAYAVSEIGPDAIVDVATLTGAMKVALGQRTGGLFANDDELARRLCSAADAAGEPLWRMPLAEDYEDRLESKVADADNAGGGPGAITAALFLQHFAGSVPWAHLDIASVGDSPEDAAEWTSGATGFGARALLHWLEQPEPLAGVTTG